MRRHSVSAIAPKSLLGSPSSKTRVMPSGYLGVKLRMTPTMMLALVLSVGTIDGNQFAVGVEVVFDEFARWKLGASSHRGRALAS